MEGICRKADIERSKCGYYLEIRPAAQRHINQAIDNSIPEERCWILFRQILDALEHIASWGIVRVAILLYVVVVS